MEALHEVQQDDNLATTWGVMELRIDPVNYKNVIVASSCWQWGSPRGYVDAGAKNLLITALSAVNFSSLRRAFA